MKFKVAVNAKVSYTFEFKSENLDTAREAVKNMPLPEFRYRAENGATVDWESVGYEIREADS